VREAAVLAGNRTGGKPRMERLKERGRVAVGWRLMNQRREEVKGPNCPLGTTVQGISLVEDSGNAGVRLSSARRAEQFLVHTKLVMLDDRG
jgi:hypothetical protein